MSNRTCAACDYELEDNAITVTIAGKAVEVCCQECADTLGKAAAATLSTVGAPAALRQ